MKKISKITLLLYLAIVIVPLAFASLLSQLKSAERGGEVVRKIARSGGEMLELSMLKQKAQREQSAQKIERSLASLEPWFAAQDTKKYYVGRSTPKRDYEGLLSCWESFKRSGFTQEAALTCWREAKEMSFALERRVSLQIARLYDTLYLTVAGVMLLLILLILFVRAAIHRELHEEEIHDRESGLLSAEYCQSLLKNLCAQAKRNEQDLSALCIRVEGVDEEMAPRKRREFFSLFGKALQGIIRQSDFACRYTDHRFVVLLPQSSKEQAQALEKRVQARLTQAMREKFPELRLHFTIKSKEDAKSCEEMIGF